jgi:8-oxo-dGTP diphosphatase
VAGVAAILFERDVIGAIGEDAVRSGLASDPRVRWSPDPAVSRVLLVRRAISPKGAWCIPCGYVEFDEDAREAVAREIEEETGILIRPGKVAAVHSNFHDPDRQSVGIWFHAEPRGGCLRPGDDVDALGFFDPRQVTVPLAFPTDELVLRDLAGS